MMSEQSLTKRIEELEGAARKARLEAMQLAGKLLSTSNTVLAGVPSTNGRRDAEIAALRARYEGLVKMANDAQVLIDRLQADEHAQKYHR
jgi:hypothetical protein